MKGEKEPRPLLKAFKNVFKLALFTTAGLIIGGGVGLLASAIHAAPIIAPTMFFEGLTVTGSPAMLTGGIAGAVLASGSSK